MTNYLKMIISIRGRTLLFVKCLASVGLQCVCDFSWSHTPDQLSGDRTMENIVFFLCHA